MACVFCEIAGGNVPAAQVFDHPHVLGFLDHRPLFPGHVLVVPRAHVETLADLPPELMQPYFSDVRIVARAVEAAMDAGGTFVAINNRVSQSVPHLHTHVVPRTKGDGLRGFFWPRTPYDDDTHRETVRARVELAIAAAERLET